MAFADMPDLFFQYKKAKRNKILGWTLPLAGIAFGIGVGTAVSVGENDTFAPAYVCGAIGLAAIGGGVVLYIKGTKKIKNIAAQYNQAMSSNAYLPDFRQNNRAYLSFSPTGIRLTF